MAGLLSLTALPGFQVIIFMKTDSFPETGQHYLIQMGGLAQVLRNTELTYLGRNGVRRCSHRCLHPFFLTHKRGYL